MLYINSHDNLHFVIYVKENRPCKLNQEINNRLRDKSRQTPNDRHFEPCWDIWNVSIDLEENRKITDKSLYPILHEVGGSDMALRPLIQMSGASGRFYRRA